MAEKTASSPQEKFVRFNAALVAAVVAFLIVCAALQRVPLAEMLPFTLALLIASASVAFHRFHIYESNSIPKPCRKRDCCEPSGRSRKSCLPRCILMRQNGHHDSEPAGGGGALTGWSL